MKQFDTKQTDELLARYRTAHHLARTQKLLTLPRKSQAIVLRDHNISEIFDKKEIDYRVSVDAIMDIVGVLEVVALATGATPLFRPKVESQLKQILLSEEIRDYHETTYPLALPTLFSARLQDKLPKRYFAASSIFAETTEMRALALLIGFVELDFRRSENRNLRLFLELLDQYEHDSVDLSIILDTLDNPEQVAEIALGRSSGENLLRDAIRGLSDFVRYCRDFKNLMQQAEDRPVLASAIWIHNSYWFGRTTKHSVKRAAKKVENFWMNVSSSSADQDSLTSIKLTEGSRAAGETVDQLFTWLTDWRARSRPIVDASQPLLVPWRKRQLHPQALAR